MLFGCDDASLSISINLNKVTINIYVIQYDTFKSLGTAKKLLSNWKKKLPNK